MSSINTYLLEICKQLLDEYNDNISPSFYLENYDGLNVNYFEIIEIKIK